MQKLTSSRIMVIFVSILAPVLAQLACASESPSPPPVEVPHQERWGIYALHLESESI